MFWRILQLVCNTGLGNPRGLWTRVPQGPGPDHIYITRDKPIPTCAGQAIDTYVNKSRLCINSRPPADLMPSARTGTNASKRQKQGKKPNPSLAPSEPSKRTHTDTDSEHDDVPVLKKTKTVTVEEITDEESDIETEEQELGEITHLGQHDPLLNIRTERLTKKWTSYIYAFYHPVRALYTPKQLLWEFHGMEEFHGIPWNSPSAKFLFHHSFSSRIPVDFHGIPPIWGIPWKSMEFYRIDFYGIPWTPPVSLAQDWPSYLTFYINILIYTTIISTYIHVYHLYGQKGAAPPRWKEDKAKPL